MTEQDVKEIIGDVIEFILDEFFETTKNERKDLANFLRERLSPFVDKEPTP